MSGNLDSGPSVNSNDFSMLFVMISSSIWINAASASSSSKHSVRRFDFGFRFVPFLILAQRLGLGGWDRVVLSWALFRMTIPGGGIR